MDAKDIATAIGFILLCQMAGIIGSVFTFESIPGWYADLVKPEFSPPNWVFGPVWTILYTFMGIAAFLVYRKMPNKKVKVALVFFGIQLALNALWSILFFGIKSIAGALICIILLACAIAWTIVHFRRISLPAALLMVPYLAWVLFATVLNYMILVLNT